MISTNDLRSGMYIVHDGRLCQVTHYEFYKPGKGASIVRVKLRDLRTGQTLEHTWKGEQRIEQAIIARRPHEYLYRDGSQFYFMDVENYDQLPLSEEKVRGVTPYLKENQKVNLVFYGTEVVSVEVPDFVELRVTRADPGVKGDTATGATKTVTLETGVNITVPLFIEEGDTLKIDTRTGDYVTRV
jgi:elongation factor P